MDDTIPQDTPQKQFRSKDKAYRTQWNREWRAANKERVFQYNEAYYAANKEHLVEQQRARDTANKEHNKQKQREYYQSHQEQLLQKTRTYHETHQEQVKAYQITYRERRRLMHLARRYGISIEQWNALYEKQGGCCAICSKSLNGTKDTVVDHCHKTGTVRGLLCGKCNTGIGMLNDSPETALRAYQYLCDWTVLVQEML